MLYNSRNSLRKAVERRHGKKLEDKTWEILEPDWEPPYDETDLNEVLRDIRDYKPLIPERKKQLKTRWKSWTLPNVQTPTTERLRPRIEDFRKTQLGLSRPAAFDEVRSTLVKLGAKESMSSGAIIPIRYYKRRRIARPYQIGKGHWELGSVYISFNHRLLILVQLVEAISHRLKCNRAEALGFILCDIRPPIHFGPNVLVDGQSINMQIPFPEVSPHLVTQLYTETRNKLLKDKRPIQGKWARPRKLSDKVRDLISFVSNTPKLSWQERFKQWNVQHPDWAYSYLRTMQTTYYRASSKYEKGQIRV